jgi:Domain of unknown function (DUF4157)
MSGAAMTHSFDQQAHAEPAPIAAPHQQQPSGLREESAAHFGAEFDDIGIAPIAAAAAVTANGADAVPEATRRMLRAIDFGRARVGAAEDAVEREAERQATGLPAQSATRMPRWAGGGVLAETHGAGRPLDDSARRVMEARLGADLSGIRVHHDEAAAASADALGARAFTDGAHIAFGRDQYQPGKPFGMSLLAHELSHIVEGHADSGVLRRDPDPKGSHSQPEEARLRVRIVDTLEATKMSAIDAMVSALERGDRAYLEGLGLSSKEIDILLNRTAQFKMMFGKAAELAVEQAVRADPFLSQYVKRVPQGWVPRGVGKPDWIIETPSSSIPVDLMTPAQIEEKLKMWQRQTPRGKPKWYVEKGLRMPYEAPPETLHDASVEPTTTGPEQVPEILPEVKVPGLPSVGELPVKLVVTEIALNVLLFAVTYYLDKWHAEKQVRKFNSDLKGLLPEIDTRLKNKKAEILERGKTFPLTYGNITIVYTHDKDDREAYNEGSMSVQDVAISHQNYQTSERLINHSPWWSDPSYSLTFSVALFEEETAEKGASDLVRNYRQVRKDLTYPAYKVRLQAVITLYKLARQDSSLETLVVRDLLGMLKDEEALVRLVAAAFLSRLKAKIAIHYIREVIPVTSDDKEKELIERSLHELEQ